MYIQTIDNKNKKNEYKKNENRIPKKIKKRA